LGVLGCEGNSIIGILRGGGRGFVVEVSYGQRVFVSLKELLLWAIEITISLYFLLCFTQISQ